MTQQPLQREIGDTIRLLVTIKGITPKVGGKNNDEYFDVSFLRKNMERQDTVQCWEPSDELKAKLTSSDDLVVLVLERRGLRTTQDGGKRPDDGTWWNYYQNVIDVTTEDVADASGLLVSGGQKEQDAQQWGYNRRSALERATEITLTYGPRDDEDAGQAIIRRADALFAWLQN